jgi:hypothetical protein
MRPSASISFFRIPAPPYCRKPIDALGPTFCPFWPRFALNARSKKDLWVPVTVPGGISVHLDRHKEDCNHG